MYEAVYSAILAHEKELSKLVKDSCVQIERAKEDLKRYLPIMEQEDRNLPLSQSVLSAGVCISLMLFVVARLGAF
jgi:hypothetical protein